jgi:integrase
MPSRRRGPRTRIRVGRVSVYCHHKSWWVYYRDGGTPVRHRVAATPDEAAQIAAQVNAQLAAGAPTLLAFVPVSVPDLRQRFLAYHEHVLHSAVSTVRRYRAATQHLEDFAVRQPNPPHAHDIRVDSFATFLWTIAVAPNGHPNTPRRRLLDKGVIFILETCRAMYAYAARHRHLPPYAGNPFAAIPIDRLKVVDAKPVFVFDAATELAFFRTADSWSLPIHATLAKTGLRVGELTHLLVEDLDLDAGWLHIRNKLALGWRIKTGAERSVPLVPELTALLRRTIAGRAAGPVFLRLRFADGTQPLLMGGRAELERACAERQRAAGPALPRAEALRVARTVWRDAGAMKSDAVRTSFMRAMRCLGRPDATCPKSWRHSFATLLQDANVDPLVRQITLGHKSANGGLGMTAQYTHTRPETQRLQFEQALRLWPESLDFIGRAAEGGAA